MKSIGVDCLWLRPGGPVVVLGQPWKPLERQPEIREFNGDHETVKPDSPSLMIVSSKHTPETFQKRCRSAPVYREQVHSR